MKSWMTGEIFKNMDAFGESLPTFILKGRKKVQTRIGGVTTILICTVVLMYAGLKFSHLMDKHNPVMSSYYKEDYYANGEAVDLSERNFRMAISVEDYLEPIMQKNDPRYVKWQFRLWGKRDGQDF